MLEKSEMTNGSGPYFGKEKKEKEETERRKRGSAKMVVEYVFLRVVRISV